MAGEYRPIFMFLAEHSIHFREPKLVCVDAEKARQALQLLKESIGP